VDSAAGRVRWRCAASASGERDAPLAHHRVVAFRETFDFAREVGRLGRRFHIGEGCLAFFLPNAERNVCADGVAKKKRFLRNKANVRRRSSRGNWRIARPSMSTVPGAAS